MKNFIVGFLLAAILATGSYWVFLRRPHESTSAPVPSPQKYYCPMHPTAVSDRPGDCPICGMTLVPLPPGKEQPSGVSGKQQYYCPMHPTFVSDKPGDCPICSMKLVPLETSAPAASHGQHPASAEAPAVPGYSPVMLTQERQQRMGIRLEEARWMPLEKSIRTVGRVTADETRLHHIHTKFDGFIEHTFVNSVGQYVRKGEPLFTIYSPELVATQKEYLLALRAQEQSPALHTEMARSGIDLVESAKQRLSLWDIDPGEIAKIEKTRQPIRALTIYSPASGFVSAKMATHGTRVSPADALYDIIDLSTIWVIADIYEVDLPFVRVGQMAEISLAFVAGKNLKGRLTFIYPTLDEKTRTAKVRFRFPNPGQRLKPEMYTDVELKSSLGKGLAVPESSVISTGERSVVFVSKEEGMFEPREIVTGVKIRNFYEVRRGLSPGEKVVIDANFLLDSESKLRAAISGSHQHGQ